MALMHAAAADHADCVRLLIDAGADKDAKSDVRVGCCVIFYLCLLLSFLLFDLYLFENNATCLTVLTQAVHHDLLSAMFYLFF